MYKYAGVIVNNSFIKLDKIFTYKIPEKLKNRVEIGFRVKVPFGIGNKILDGFIVRLYSKKKESMDVKDINDICDDFSLFTEKDLELIENMREKYLCTYLECIKVFTPAGIFKGIKNKKKNFIFAGKKLEGKFNKDPYKSIYELIKNNNGMYTKNFINKSYNVSLSSLNTMIKYGFILSGEKIVNRYNTVEYEKYSKKKLNKEQQNAVDKIINSHKRIFLIHGVTGSGKTEIYMHIVEKALKENKESLILVPEIALTPQMVERFKGRFGSGISVVHSKLSDGERYDEWMRIKKKKVKVAIGARSAIFLPFENLGFIIIDEEHEGSYKSDSNPKYNVKEIGEMKCSQYGCKMILGSATPSIETYYRCKTGEIELITIENRVNGIRMPEVEILDMRKELLNNNKSMFSRALYKAICDRLAKKEQIILFLNRRGYSTFVSCRKCGYVFKCNKCDISFTYHYDKKKLICHYCGSVSDIPKMCPKCFSKYVKYFGLGTEKVEQEIKRLFPEADVLRMDFDTTRSKNSYEDIYNKFKNKKADILIGTQMVAKGLDFKDVTLVGVIAADVSINLPDFRAAERTYELITQVSGRAGRGEKPGKVIIQTYNPEIYSIRCAADNDYKSFYQEEINIRKNMEYPPFVDLLLINMSSKNENLLIKSIQNVGIFLKSMWEKDDRITLLGPCPCQISKIKELYRWQIILKGQIEIEDAKNVRKTVYHLLKHVYNDIRVSIDMNPYNML